MPSNFEQNGNVEKMLQSFLNMEIAENAFVGRQGLISAAKDVSCAQPVLE
jgi:hypothetical protein